MTTLEKLAKAYEYSENYEQKVKDAATIIKQQLGFSLRGSWVPPEFGIVLGSGLGDLANEITDVQKISYENIPDFPRTTVPGHEGTLIYGKIENVPVLAMKGRKHFYEVAGAPFNADILETVFPVHVLAELGIKNYFATNAAGGLNQDFNVGDLMIIKTHINMIKNPLLERKLDFKTVDGKETRRFQPMNDAYDVPLTAYLYKAANIVSDLSTHLGTYLALTGPSYETKGECLYFRDSMGVDAVGMSTAPEVIVARNRGMKCVAMSCITNKISQDGNNVTTHEEVKAVLDAPDTRKRLCDTVKKFFDIYSLWVWRR